MTVEIPAKFSGLFDPHRYKVLYGGRAGMKSWCVARIILIKAASKPLRILCTREVQKSLKESVYKLLCDQIEAMGLGANYEIQRETIKGVCGSEFIFAGLSDMTTESIKSYEGVDIVWVEEAQAVGERSWQILTPTIRKPRSEIWVTFNPELDTDPVWKRFVVNTPPDCLLIHTNWRDTLERGWLSKELQDEREHAEKTLSPDDYNNIWEGRCRSSVVGAIYTREVEQIAIEKRLTSVPYDPMLKAHVVVDLGFNDSMAIAIVQRQASSIRVIDYIEDRLRTLDSYSADLKEKRLNWGNLWLPHDGFAKNVQTGKTAAEVFRALGWSVERVPDMSLENGIKYARQTARQVTFDTKASRLVECLKRYRRSINKTTNEPGSPLHDEYSHGADCFRYLCISAEQMTNDEWNSEFRQPIYSLA